MSSSKFGGTDWIRLANHVAPFNPTVPGYVSTFTAAVREARFLTGRNLQSGLLGDGGTPALWSGSTVYLILLEQIGKSLRPKWGRSIKKEPKLEKALRQFTPGATTPHQRRALYALRCAWVHEFGLFNVNNKDDRYQHCFALDDSVSAPLVRGPRRRWDGVTLHATPTTSTYIGLPALGNLVEDVVRSIRIHSNSGTLRPELGTEELRKRFGFERTS